MSDFEDENKWENKWEQKLLIEPWPPPWLEKFKAKVDTIAKFLIAALEVVNTIMEVIKAFLVGIADPLSALIKKLMEEIKKLLRDLSQLGLYATGDWKVLQQGRFSQRMKNLLGGYSGAEKRMIGRLTDRSDPGRPNLSSGSYVFGFMLFASADSEMIGSLLKTIELIMKLLKFGRLGDVQSPITNVTVSYMSNDPTYAPTHGKIFNKPAEIEVSWKQASGYSAMGVTLPTIPAEGFIIEVSTEVAGMPLMLCRKKNTAQPAQSGASQEELVPLYGKDGHPVVLYGGHDRVGLVEMLKYTNATDKEGKRKNGYSYVVASHRAVPSSEGIGPALVPLELMKDVSNPDLPKYFFQRSFIYSTATGFMKTGPGAPHSFTIKHEQLPVNAKIEGKGSDMKLVEDTENPPATFAIRIAAVPDDLKMRGADYNDGKFEPLDYDLSYQVPKSDVDSEERVVIEPIGKIEKFCKPVNVVIPRENTQLFMETLQAALLVLILSRPDLDPDDGTEGRYTIRSTGFDKNGTLEILNKVLRMSGVKFFKNVEDPKAFERKLKRHVKRMASKIIDFIGPLPITVEQLTIDNTTTLREWKWRDYDLELPDLTLLESVGLKKSANTNADSGLAPNWKSLFVSQGKTKNTELVLTHILSPLYNWEEDITGGTHDSISYPNDISLDVYTTQLKSLKLIIADSKVTTKTKKAAEDQLEWMESTDPSVGGFLRDINGNLKTKNGRNGLIVNCWQLGKKPVGGVAKPDRTDLPIIYTDIEDLVEDPDTSGPSRAVFCRTALLSDSAVIPEAALILKIPTAGLDINRYGSSENWEYIRLGRSLGIEKVFNYILNFIEMIMKAMQSVIDVILRYIEWVQQRIKEVQNLIRRINAIIQSLGLFELPEAKILYFFSRGTDGVLMDLITSEDKPDSGSTHWGFSAMGLVPVPGGAIIMDIIEMFSGKDMNDSALETTG